MLARVLAVVWLLPLCAMAQGMLLPTDPNLSPLGIKYQRVSVEIRDGAAVTKVEQVFVNEGPRQLEAHYVFPLPKGAALSEFYLWINGVKTKGEVMEKEKAAAIYEGIVRRLKDPGLLEYIDSDVFRARVFPVPAKGEQRIELSFSQVLEFQGGVYRYHYPLGAASRGAPRLPVKSDFTFSARLQSKVPIRGIYSPTHPLGVQRKGENAAVVGLEMGPGTDISKDLDLYYTVSEKAIGLSLLAFREGDEPGYFLALISPKSEVQQSEIIGKRVTFVIDTSGSMTGDRMPLAKKTLEYCIRRLNPHDSFNVVRFSTDVEALFDSPQKAHGDNVEKALAFVRSMEPIGGTAIDEALKRALADGQKEGKGPHLVLFITDGHPTVGETDEEQIAKNASAANRGRSRIFTFGVGDELNARLLDRLAADGNGVSDFARDGKEFEMKVSTFYDKISHPVLADLSLDLKAIAAYDVYPKKLPDLFKGGQLVVVGRYREPGEGKVKLAGYVDGARKEFEYATVAPKESTTESFIPRLWAIRKVGYLLEEIRLGGERPELKQEVIALGKKFGIVTPYTSYLVVEDERPEVAVRLSPDGARLRPAEPPASRAVPPAPAAEPEDFSAVFGRGGQGLKSSEGKAGIAVSKKMKAMKEEERAASADEPVRVASGRTFVWRKGAWVDSEAVGNAGKQLEVKYLSPAYFALLKARPDLKAALALGDRVVVVVGSGRTIAVTPDGGEEKEDRLLSFLR